MKLPQAVNEPPVQVVEIVDETPRAVDVLMGKIVKNNKLVYAVANAFHSEEELNVAMVNHYRGLIILQ